MRFATPRWHSEQPETRFERMLLAPLAALELAYRAGAALHRGCYSTGLFARARAPLRVISIGNLSSGGTGKTPFAAWLASSLRARGHRVALLSRGYGRSGPGTPLLVSDGAAILSDAARAGDEALLLAKLARGVPVLAGVDRARLAELAFASHACDVAILDDGFQHHRLHRDLDLVLLDCEAGLGNGHLLPRGPLRESAAALARCSAIAFVDGPPSAALAGAVARHAAGVPRFELRRKPGGLRSLADGRPLGSKSLAGASVGLVAGIARPASLRRSVEALGARVVAERWYPDHHRYRAKDFAGLVAQAPRWITTEKDAVKIDAAWTQGVPFGVLGLELEVREGERLLDHCEAKLARDERRASRENGAPGSLGA
jgi:tetraacyldisaccharide 4'-kinase